MLIAYVFDLTSSKTKIPSAILLLLLGWILRQIIDFLGIQLPNFTPILPVLGTVGLILIPTTKAYVGVVPVQSGVAATGVVLEVLIFVQERISRTIKKK